MKTKILLTSLCITTNCLAQNVTLAEWDIRYIESLTDSTQTYTQAGRMTADSTADCIENTMFDVNGIGYSGQGGDSEDTSGTVIPNLARCFGGWTNNLDTNKYVSFQVGFAALAHGSINAINFDIKNYSATGDATKFAVRLYDSNNTLVGSTLQPVGGYTITQSWQDYTLNFFPTNGGGTSTIGSSDVYEARFYAYNVDGTSTNPRISIDHVRVLGDVNCVPEPSSFLLSALGTLVLLRRRR